MKNITPENKKKLISIYPELQSYFAEQEKGDPLAEMMLSTFISKMKELKGEKGDQGEAGYTPVKGKDYWTKEDLQQFEEIKNLLNGRLKDIGTYSNEILKRATPVKGVHYRDGKDGARGERGLPGLSIKGKDGSPDNPKQIAEKLNTLKGALDSSVIKDGVSKTEFETKTKSIDSGMAKMEGRVKLLDQRWHGGGLSRVSHDSTLTGDGTASSPLSVVGTSTGFQKPTGTVDGSNTTFVWATAPNAIVVDQGRTIQKVSSDGTVNWTGTTTTVLTIAPNYDIFSIA